MPQLRQVFIQNIRRKIIYFSLLALVLTSAFYPETTFRLRVGAYCVYKKAATFVLDRQTKEYNSVENEELVLKYIAQDEEISAFMLETAEEYFNEVKKRLGDYPQKRRVLLILYSAQDLLNESFGWEEERSAAGVYWAGNIRTLSPGAGRTQVSVPEKKIVFRAETPLAHELAHYVVDEKTGGNYTRWLTEGLAQLAEKEINGFKLAEPTAEEREKLYSLQEIDKYFDRYPQEVLAYWQSLKTVEYLVAQEGWEGIRTMLELLGKGKDLNNTLLKTYGISLKELQEIMEIQLTKRYN